jgi:hypothetical protein
MDGPRPSSLYAPSTWYEAVAEPHRKPLGKLRGADAVCAAAGRVKSVRVVAATDPPSRRARGAARKRMAQDSSRCKGRSGPSGEVYRNSASMCRAHLHGATGASRRYAEMAMRLENFEQQKDDNDHQDKRNASSSVVADAGTHAITAKAKHKNQNDKKNQHCSKLQIQGLRRRKYGEDKRCDAQNELCSEMKLRELGCCCFRIR